MTAQAPVRTTDVEEHAFADVLTGLREHGPATAFELAALIATMETVPQAEVRRVAATAVVVERLAVGLGRPDLEMRARLIRADALQRDGDTVESGRLSQQVQVWAADNGDDHLLARSHNLLGSG
ncbi:hypothetical protein HC031_29880 [Planosporangium thailandense]|uniref:DUF222 domain-containing protein n=1 Tax=Planosporangium thailandense TaxID=765197 RepID=A0ABX0Y654_9ACTN|nr:hypothetical protein [Planosporangium thailandense]